MRTGRKFARIVCAILLWNASKPIVLSHQEFVVWVFCLMVLTFICSQRPTFLLGSTLPNNPVSLMSEADVQFTGFCTLSVTVFNVFKSVSKISVMIWYCQPVQRYISLDKFHCLDCEDDTIETPPFWVGGRYTWDESKKKLISALISPYLMLRCYLEFLKAGLHLAVFSGWSVGCAHPLCGDAVTRCKVRKGMGTHHEEWNSLFSVVSLYLYIFGSCTLLLWLMWN